MLHTELRSMTEQERQRVLTINDRLCVAAWHDERGDSDTVMMKWIAESEGLLMGNILIKDTDGFHNWMEKIEQWLVKQEALHL